MSLGQDILQAVKLGGLENWRPQCEKTAAAKIQHIPQRRTEQLGNLVLEVMGEKVWTVASLGKEPKIIENIGNRRFTVRAHLHRLVDAGKVAKSKNSQPHKFWRINTNQNEH